MTDLATKSGADEASSDDDVALVDDPTIVDDADDADAAEAMVDDVEESEDVETIAVEDDAPVDEAPAEDATALDDEAPVEDTATIEDDEIEPVDETILDDDTSPEDEAPAEEAAVEDEAPVEEAAPEDEIEAVVDDDTALEDEIEHVEDETAPVDDDTTLEDDAALEDDDIEPVEDDTAFIAAVESPVDSIATEADAATAVISAPSEAPVVPDEAPTVRVEAPVGGGPDAPAYAWAPAEPRPRKSRKALWIGLGAGAAVIALAVASVTLIAPGTSIAGVPVGFLPTAAATDAVQQRLATTTIVLTGEGGDAEVTGADLGASVDASGLAADAFAAHPLWNVTAWFPASADAPVRIDEEIANSALRAVAPELYTDPVNATLAFDATTISYVTTPAVAGTGIDVDAVRVALQEAFAAGETRVELEATVAPVEATTPSYVAEASAKQLNTILDTAGFYVGSERTVPIDRAVAASWLTVTPGERGTFDIAVDSSTIEEVVATLPATVNREVVNASVITDSGGGVLREIAAGVTGRTLGDTSSIADEFAAQLAAGSGRYELPVEETAFATSTVERRIEVDLGAQTTYLFENDKVIRSYAISSGLPGTPTHTGSYRIFAHVPIQDMGALCYNPEAQNSYCTKDVPWVTYFNGDQGFHGTYWHNNFGNRMSHGCVNMPIDIAKFVYDWAPTGTEVWVHA